jgi:hypothetical protein
MGVFALWSFMPTITQTPTTELEAINALLATTGESPVNVLVDSGVVTADIARTTLHEVNRAYQSEGWHFNTEIDYGLVPDVSGFLNVPTNVLQIETADDYKDNDVVRRGSRIYNRTTHSYVFASNIAFNMVVFLPYEELPEASRQYILITAARLFQDRVLGADALHAFNEQDVENARQRVEKEEIENSQTALLKISRAFQTRGWWFNTDINVTLTPDGSSNLVVPAGTLKVSTTRDYKDQDIVVRGTKLWNRLTNSFTFSTPIAVDIVKLLPHSLLPQSVRDYIQLVATRNLQAMAGETQDGKKQLGYRYGNLLGVTAQDEQNALLAIEREDVLLSQTAMLEASRAFQSRGWWFNTDINVGLFPDGSGNINVPAGTLSAETTRDYKDQDIVLRGTKLWNRTANSYVFSALVATDIIKLLPISELPEVVRRYLQIVTLRARTQPPADANGKQQVLYMNSNLSGMTLIDEQNAMLEIEKEEALSSQTALYQASRTIQSMGWWFNTDYNVTITPNGSGYCVVPVGTIKIEITNDQYNTAIELRGTKLYNLLTQSSVFTQPVICNVISQLPYSSLPESAMRYIRIQAVRSKLLSNIELPGYSLQEEQDAYVELQRADLDNRKCNMLTDSYGVFETIHRMM